MEELKAKIAGDSNEIYDIHIPIEYQIDEVSIQATVNNTENESGSKHNNHNKLSSGKTRIRKAKNKAVNMQKVDVKAKLERSRQSARECRARKKLRYQYLEDLVTKRESANILLKKEIEQLKEVVSMVISDQYSLEEIKKHYANI